VRSIIMSREIVTLHHPAAAVDFLKVDAYWYYLLLASAQCRITVTKNICDAEGNTLIPAAHTLSADASLLSPSVILQYPLDESIQLEHEITAIQLEQDFMRTLQKDSVLNAIHEHYNFDELLRENCEYFSLSALLRQKLTMMSIVMPENYRRALYCAWISLLMAKEMRLAKKDLNIIFVAALCHDMGMLHIHPRFMQYEVELSDAEWLHVQSHCLISKHIIERVPSLPSQTATAVYEHHERCDGTGYPLGKYESEMEVHGLIIGFADSVVAIYRNRFMHKMGSWRDVVSVIELNRSAYWQRNYDIMNAVLSHSELPLANVVQDNPIPEFARSLHEKNMRLQQWFIILRDALVSIGFIHGDRRLHSIQNIIFHLTTTIEGAGIFYTEKQVWLVELAQSDSLEQLQALKEFHVVQQEIVFHLQRLTRMLANYLANNDCDFVDISTQLKAAMFKAQAFFVH